MLGNLVCQEIVGNGGITSVDSNVLPYGQADLDSMDFAAWSPGSDTRMYFTDRDSCTSLPSTACTAKSGGACQVDTPPVHPPTQLVGAPHHEGEWQHDDQLGG